MFREILGYPRAFKVLFVSALIENVAFGIIIPFLTLYMKDDLQIGEVLIGIVLMGYTVSGIPAMIVGGMLADKIGRRTVLLMSLGMMSITIMAYFFVTDFYTILAVALADSFVGTLYMPAANAMIADVIPSPDRPKAFSTLRIGWNVGIVIGPVIGAIMVAALGIRALFLFGSSILVAAFVMNLIFIPETKPKDTGEEITFRKVAAVARDKPFFALCALTMVFWFFFSQWISVLPIYATGNLGLQDWAFGILFAVSGMLVVAIQIPVTSRTERYRRASVLLGGQLVASIGFGLIFLAAEFWTLMACILVITMGEIIYMSIIGAIIADFSPESKRGIYMGFSGFLQTLGNGVGFLFGMVLLSVLPGHESYVWLVFSAIGLVTCLGYPPWAKMIGHERNKPTKQLEPVILPADELIPGKAK